jgi:glycosyltransferase involved in cell wall biosynthesis
VATPRVSILIPAYNERFFAEALESARGQTYPDLEIVVCDDSPGERIRDTTAGAGDSRVRYVRNASRLGFEGNFTECLRQARGELAKFLNDDDRLAPACVAALVGGFDFDPRITLATSRRVVIDERGVVQPDVLATTPVSRVSCFIPGKELADFALINSANLIGEPSTVMFRKRDVNLDAGGLFTWGERHYHCLADLSLWIRLLARGAAFYQASALSEFRMHSGQEQGGPTMEVECIAERIDLAHQARAGGFLREPRHLRAALSRTLALAQLWLNERPIPQPHRDELQRLSSALAGEIASLPA